MADGAATFLLETVVQILRYYGNLLGKAKSELEGLQVDLNLLKAFLNEAALNPKKQESLREMEKQIRMVVYDVEDTVDSCILHATGHKPFINFKRINLAKQVRGARTKVTEMLDKSRNQFINMPPPEKDDQDQPWRPQSLQVIRQENVVGFTEEEREIFDFLMAEKKELDVFSIVGMPGLGKTTLAWKVFQRKDVQYEFPMRIWVNISQDYSIRDVFIKIMSKFTGADLSSVSGDKLTEDLRNALATGKFLLVLDDVWDVEAWSDIQHVLTRRNGDGKVVITTRYTNVGARASGRRPPHQLRLLNSDESWELLQYEVFQGLGRCPEHLDRVGMKIAEQCDGLPLAIVIIGGIMLGHLRLEEIPMTLHEWDKISSNVFQHVQGHDEDKRASKVVELSYNKMPDELRDCFLYLGVFPEDHKIPTWTLMNLWIAEGFIQQKQEKSLEEIAQDNLKDLINRNLVMVDKTNPIGEVKICHVHDVIREFCRSKAALDEQNLFQEIKLTKEGTFFPSIKDLHQHRRLCIHSHLPKFLNERIPDSQRARSFLCFYKEPIVLPANRISSIPDDFKLLRVLDSNSFLFSGFPFKVKELIHLRYLTLSFDKLKSLPEDLTALLMLQTLIVDTKSRELNVKANIWKLNQLRHLKTKAAILLDFKAGEEEKCSNLQTMSQLSPEYCTQDVFNHCCNIKKLGIRGRIATLLNPKYSLRTLNRLQHLKLENDLFHELGYENPPGSLPQSTFYPQNLRTLTLLETYLNWSQMSMLAKIANLQVLKLKKRAFVGDTWTASGDGFHSLEFLLISNADELVYWDASPDHFPRLWTLMIKNCKKLQNIPESAARNLHKLEIEHVGATLMKCTERIEEEKKQKGVRFKLNIGIGCK